MNVEPTNHPFRKESDLPKLHFWMSIFQGCSLPDRLLEQWPLTVRQKLHRKTEGMKRANDKKTTPGWQFLKIRNIYQVIQSDRFIP